ncbi:hypothetical protein JDS82_29455, partial [Bacillus cereus group sp. N14]|uniref:hypothetical protein n=1 Tax=Bacillus cereus group sp. N14 TaxID=2794587 RepID=UPI0018F4DB0B
DGSIFLANTVTIICYPISIANASIGILIGTIGAISSRTVSFQVIVPTITAAKPITNHSGTTIHYTYDPSKPAILPME